MSKNTSFHSGRIGRFSLTLLLAAASALLPFYTSAQTTPTASPTPEATPAPALTIAAASDLQFERAASLRDEMIKFKKMLQKL
jgi:hypothetical protein